MPFMAARRLIVRLALGLCLAAALSPIAHAGPTPSVPIMRVSEVREGMRGYGLTVFKGTSIERFPITILGVIKNYIAESDLILIRVDGGYPVHHGVGIVAGMSGSPVYVNGRLIGAVAYGWPFSKEPIGGVTPIESMLKDLPGSPRASSTTPAALSPTPRRLAIPIRVKERLFKRVQIVPSGRAARTLPTDMLVLSPVTSLFQVSGFSERAFKRLEGILRPLNMEPVRTFAAASPGRARVPRMDPGAAVGVQLLTGDLEIAGTGTLTYVDGKRFLAFGHPMAMLGDVSLPMTAAYVQGVLPSYQRPFKFASQIGRVGALTSDRLWAVGGILGAPAPMIPVTITMSQPSHNVHKTYRLKAIQHRVLTPAIVTQAMLEGLNSVIPAGADTTAVVEYHIKPRGRDMISLHEVSTGSTVEAVVATQFNQYLAQLTNNDFAPLSLESVEVDVKIISGKRTATIDKIYTARTVYRRGDDIDLHVVLHPYGKEPIEKVVRVPVPADMEKGTIMIGVAGGNDVPAIRKRLSQLKPEATNIDQLLALMVDQERGQQLVVKVAYPSKAAVIGQDRFAFLPDSLRDVIPSLPQSGIGVEKDFFEERIDTEWVVRGAEVINTDVSVPSDGTEKKKAAVDDGAPGTWGRETPARLEPVSVGVAVEPRGTEKKEETRKKDDRKREADSTASADKVLPGGTRRWDLRDAAAFSQGSFDGTSLSSSGTVSLAPSTRSLLTAGGDVLFSLARDPRDGTLLAGTASHGQVLRLAPDGSTVPQSEPKRNWKVGDTAVTAIAVGPDGTTWMGTGPHGRVYRKSPGEAPRLALDAAASYVWSLVPQADGGLLVGTGNPGKLLALSANGGVTVVASFSERHVRVVAAAGDGELLVGTAGTGAVYRLRGSQRQPLFTTSFGSVDGLLQRANGEVLAASGKSVYRLTPHGAVRVLPVADRPLLALAEDVSGRVYAAGATGKVYAIDGNDAVVRVADFDRGAVMALLPADTGMLAATSAPGSVMQLQETRTEGVWTSDTLDAGSVARWGRIRWMMDGNGKVSVQTRSGYAPVPDATWSAWSAEHTIAEGMQVTSPPGRYLQVKARLAAGGADLPRLNTLTVFFRNNDLQPALDFVLPSGGERLSGTARVQWKASGAGVDSMTYDLSCSSDGRNWTSIQRALGAAVKETAVNAASPPKDPVQTEEYSWDTRKVADGLYRLRIEAYDVARPDSAATVLASRPFIVANTPPTLEPLAPERLANGHVRFRGIARSRLAALVSVAFKLSGREWQIALPDDGVYDSDREAFSFIVPVGADVEIRITDEAGNSRTVRRSP